MNRRTRTGGIPATLRRKRKATVWSAFYILILSVNLTADQRVISQYGKDDNPGTFKKPWRTLAKANRAVAAGDTVVVLEGAYAGDINPVRSGQAGRPIVFLAQSGKEVLLSGSGDQEEGAVVAIGYPGSESGWEPKSHIEVDGFRIRPGRGLYGVVVWGKESSGNTVRNCVLTAPAGSGIMTRAAVIHGASHTALENIRLEGSWEVGVVCSGGPRNTILRNNVIENCIASGIVIQSSSGQNQAMLVEGNVISGSKTEDGIQFEPDGSDFDPGQSQGVVIRGNFITDNAENGIDLKGAADVVIEQNMICRNRGDNDGSGNTDGGSGGIMKGDIRRCQARRILIRHNLIIDNFGGISISGPEWVVVHNTVVSNNRTNRGPDRKLSDPEVEASIASQRLPELTGIRIVEPYVDSFEGCVVKNNVLGGHVQGQMAIRISADLKGADIEPNGFVGFPGVRLALVRSAWDWEWTAPDQLFESIVGGRRNRKVISRVVSDSLSVADFLNLARNGFWGKPSPEASWTIDAGDCLSRTRSVGKGVRLPLENVFPFSDGFSIIPGDTVQLASSGAKAVVVSVDRENHCLVLDRSLTWSKGEGVSYPWDGKAPDLGFFKESGMKNWSVEMGM